MLTNTNVEAELVEEGIRDKMMYWTARATT